MKRTVCAIVKVEKSLLRGDCCIGIKSFYISQNLNALKNSHLFICLNSVPLVYYQNRK